MLFLSFRKKALGQPKLHGSGRYTDLIDVLTCDDDDEYDYEDDGDDDDGDYVDDHDDGGGDDDDDVDDGDNDDGDYNDDGVADDDVRR